MYLYFYYWIEQDKVYPCVLQSEQLVAILAEGKTDTHIYFKAELTTGRI